MIRAGSITLANLHLKEELSSIKMAELPESIPQAIIQGIWLYGIATNPALSITTFDYFVLVVSPAISIVSIAKAVSGYVAFRLAIKGTSCNCCGCVVSCGRVEGIQPTGAEQGGMPIMGPGGIPAITYGAAGHDAAEHSDAPYTSLPQTHNMINVPHTMMGSVETSQVIPPAASHEVSHAISSAGTTHTGSVMPTMAGSRKAPQITSPMSATPATVAYVPPQIGSPARSGAMRHGLVGGVPPPAVTCVPPAHLHPVSPTVPGSLTAAGRGGGVERAEWGGTGEFRGTASHPHPAPSMSRVIWRGIKWARGIRWLQRIC